MFRRLVWQMMIGNRSRLTVALVAVISGAAVISSLLNLQFDIARKLTQEFRVLGANVVIAPAQNARPAATATDGTIDTPSLIDEDAALTAVDRNRTGELEAAAPFFVLRCQREQHSGHVRRHLARSIAQAESLVAHHW